MEESIGQSLPDDVSTNSSVAPVWLDTVPVYTTVEPGNPPSPAAENESETSCKQVADGKSASPTGL